MIKVKDDKTVLGLLQPIKANWEGCIKLNCPKLHSCIKKPVDKVKSLCHLGNKSPVIISKMNTSGVISNLTPNWYRNAIISHTFGVTTPTLKVNYLVLSCHYDPPSYDDVIENEIGRVALTSSSDSGATGSSEGSFGLSDAITGNYTITAVASKKLFSLNSIVGLHEGDFIKVKLSAYSNQEIDCKIKTLPVSGTQIEIEVELPALPSVSDIVTQYLGRVILAANGTLTPGTGNPVSIALYRETKSNAETIQVRHSITLL